MTMSPFHKVSYIMDVNLSMSNRLRRLSFCHASDSIAGTLYVSALHIMPDCLGAKQFLMTAENIKNGPVSILRRMRTRKSVTLLRSVLSP